MNTVFTGGEIKNILLNAARHAVCRGTDAKIEMRDFHWAMESERKGRFSTDENMEKIGFRRA